jgi:hypothetical protein
MGRWLVAFSDINKKNFFFLVFFFFFFFFEFQNIYFSPREFSFCLFLFLIRFRGVFGTFQLDFEPFGADLKAVHGLDGRLGAHRVVVRHET